MVAMLADLRCCRAARRAVSLPSHCRAPAGTDVPFTHSRTGQKRIWIKHLHALKAKGLCAGVSSKAYKTLAKWTNQNCKKNVAFRNKEKRQSGLAQVLPAQSIDTVSELWHAFKISSDLASDASFIQAEIIREAATVSNPTLQARAAAIQCARHAIHRAQPPRVSGNAAGATGEESDDAIDPVPAPPRSFLSPRSETRQPAANRSTTAQQVREMLAASANSQITQSELAHVVGIMHSFNNAPPASPFMPAIAAPASKLERLRELQQLLTEGIVTQDESDQARQAILRS